MREERAVRKSSVFQGADIGSRTLDPYFGNDRFCTYLRIQEDFYEKIKGSWRKNKPVRKEIL
jgi:hypothetical protein